jgi:hypothetical protein
MMMSKREPTPARIIVNEMGVSNEQLGIVLRCQYGQVHKYLGGHRRLGPGQQTALVSEYGDAAHRLIEACAQAFAITNAERPFRLATSNEVTRDYAAERRSEDDGERITIDEWKARYGEPGSGADTHGRIGGVFASEPCFIGE